MAETEQTLFKKKWANLNLLMGYISPFTVIIRANGAFNDYEICIAIKKKKK